jgi:hypothetical protein
MQQHDRGDKTMQHDKWRTNWEDILYVPPDDEWKPPEPPPRRPTLVTEDGKFAEIAEEFTVYVSVADPNAVKGFGQGIRFRRRRMGR